MSNELYHHGIKGQKWGVRRYQNPDGSLTKLGKLRYGTPENLRKSYVKKVSKKQHKDAYKKDIKSMSDEELRNNIERLRLEKQLKELKESDIKKGESAVKRIFLKSAESAATSITTTAFTNAGKYTIKELTGLDINDVNFGKIKEKTELEKLQDEFKLASTKAQLRKLREDEENRKKQE